MQVLSAHRHLPAQHGVISGLHFGSTSIMICSVLTPNSAFWVLSLLRITCTCGHPGLGAFQDFLIALIEHYSMNACFKKTSFGEVSSFV